LTAEVTFARSGISAIWDRSCGTLLELAEELGLTPRYGCRSGMCGACAVPIVTGEVQYARPTLAEPQPGTALLCKAVPRGRIEALDGAHRPRLILDV